MNIKTGYKQTEIGVIPEDWEVKTIFEIAEKKKELFNDGDWIEFEHITNDGIRLIQTGNIGIGSFVEKENKKYIFQNSFEKLACKELKIGDLLICRLAEPAGRACVFPDINEDKVITSVDVTIFRPRNEIADRNFLSNVFSTTDWFKSVSEMCGGTTHKRISRGALGRIKISLPPLPEQTAIAAALSDVDALMGELDKLIAKKRDIKQATMQQLLTGKKRLAGFSGEWEVKRVCMLGDVVTGGTPSTTINEYWGEEYPWVTPTDISTRRDMDKSERQLTQKGLNAIRRLPKNTVLITCIASIGKNAILRTEGSCNQQINALIPNAENHAEFLYYLFETSKQYLQANAGTTATSIISKATFSELTFSIPTLEEQTAIATILSDMDAEISQLEARRAKTAQLKQGMMQELLTGKTRLI